MGGKLTNAQLLAVHARQKLKDIATIEGHDVVPGEEELAQYLAELGPEDNPIQNQHLEEHKISANIADLFRGGRK